jgi:hypothetical protein
VRTSPSTACFDAVYAPCDGAARQAFIEAVTTIDPPPDPAIARESVTALEEIDRSVGLFTLALSSARCGIQALTPESIAD